MAISGHRRKRWSTLRKSLSFLSRQSDGEYSMVASTEQPPHQQPLFETTNQKTFTNTVGRTALPSADTSSSTTGPCTFSFDASQIIDGDSFRAKQYPGGVNPLGCHPDVTLLSRGPDEPPITLSLGKQPSAMSPIPHIYIQPDCGDIADAIIYSPSTGGLNRYARRTPSPAQSSYASQSTTEHERPSTSTRTSENRIQIHKADRRAKDMWEARGLARSITGLFAKLGAKRKEKEKMRADLSAATVKT